MHVYFYTSIHLFLPVNFLYFRLSQFAQKLCSEKKEVFTFLSLVLISSCDRRLSNEIQNKIWNVKIYITCEHIKLRNNFTSPLILSNSYSWIKCWWKISNSYSLLIKIKQSLCFGMKFHLVVLGQVPYSSFSYVSCEAIWLGIHPFCSFNMTKVSPLFLKVCPICLTLTANCVTHIATEVCICLLGSYLKGMSHF